MTDRTVTIPAEHVEQALALIEDMSRFVGNMALQDYARLNESPMNLRKALSAPAPVEDLLFYKLKDLIRDQSEGEWGDETIVKDAHRFASAIRPMLNAPDPEVATLILIRSLLDHVDRETCTHENTKRGGSIWTICEDCGRKWADDEGGFKPHVDAPAVRAARNYLEARAK